MVELTDGGSHDASRSSSPAGRGFWLSWALASVVGWVVGGPIGEAMGSSRGLAVSGFVSVAVGGVVARTLQWFVLRRQIAGTGSWVPATIVAVITVGVLVFAMGVVDAGLGVAVTGTVLGVAQWLVLRRQVARAGWWVLASTVGWVTGGFLSGVFSGGLAGWATIGTVYGVITGAALVWLLRHRPPGSGQPFAAPDGV